MVYEFTPRGVCSRKMEITIDGGKVTDLKVIGGCDGNLHGISALVKGMTVDEVINRLEGIDCRGKGTSCPDQLACALKEFKSRN